MVVAESTNHLAVQLYHLLAKEKGNIFYSPFGISTAMAMILFAAEGETEAEMRKVLGYEEAATEKEKLISEFQQQMSELMKITSFTSSNSLITQKTFKVKDEYKSILSECFKALMVEANFHSDAKNVVKQINAWVKEKTNNMITELLECLDPDTVMVILNAVYFKGSWLKKFDEALTSPRKFYNKGKAKHAKIVQMMQIEKYFFFYESKNFQALHLPYEGDEMAMLILLPRKKDGLEKLEATLTPSLLKDLCEMTIAKEVKVFLPRFRLEYSKSLVPLFKRLGIQKLFRVGAQLGGASDSDKLALSEVYHKAVLEVNEEGTAAAAGTRGMVILLSGNIRPYEFIADHPFLFVIYEVKSSLILYMGRVQEL